MKKGKIYFISDAHLGMYPPEKSRERERLLVNWLDSVKDEMAELYLLGDIFDFWYEYKKVVPRGFTRFLGKLGELADKGVKIHFFVGNHDVWAFDYFEKELGATIYRKPLQREIMGKKFYLAHGDGLGPGDKFYLILKWAFHNKVLQWLFSRLHPNFSLMLGHSWSKRSRYSKGFYANFKGGKQEWLIIHAKEILKKEHFDYFIFGHRHLAVQLNLNEKTQYIVLGDWIYHFTYAEFDGEKLELKFFKKNEKAKIIKKDIPD